MNMQTSRILVLLSVFQLFLLAPMSFAGDEAADAVTSHTRCTVCGMFVAKYPNWLARIRYDDPTETRYFDGVKDMMVYYFNPEQYGGPSRDAIRDMQVKDYYSLNWIPAKEAFFVIGSDVYGPMGHEFIPFQTREAADSFSKDHHGKNILTFKEITSELVESMRHGQKMR